MTVRPRILPLLVGGTLLFALPITASAQAPQPSLAQERAAAKAAGLELSIGALSAPMPPDNENAAPLYSRFAALSNKRALAPKGSQADADFKVLNFSNVNPESRTTTEWSTFDGALSRCSEEISLVRRAAMLNKCVFKQREYGDPEEFAEAARMRSAVRLLVAVGLSEAHAHKTAEAIRDVALGFRIAAQINQYDTIVNYLTAGAVDGVTAGGFRGILRLSANDPSTCRAVQAAIEKNWHGRPLSSALKIEAAIGQDFVDQIIKSAPDPRLDAYGAFLLREMRKAIDAADLPYSQSAPLLDAIGKEVERQYPEKGEFPTPAFGFSGAVFQRDSFANQVNIVQAAAAVLAYHAEHGKYPAALADAMSNPPTDAFDGQPLHYEITPTGFVISATHQRSGHKPEPAIFRYPL